MIAEIEILVMPQIVERPARFTGWRCLHMAEGGYPNPEGMPAVRPCKTAPPVQMTKEIQLLSWELMHALNPTITKKQWRSVYRFDRAFTNGNGFDEPGDPRADFVNGVDLDKPLPKLMDAIICGGAFLRGEERAGRLYCRPGVHGIDARSSLPSIDEIIARHWYFAATVGYRNKAEHFPQGNGGIVAIPYFLVTEVSYPIEWFCGWNADFPPDPITLYVQSP